jgi:hypothetical protein
MLTYSQARIHAISCGFDLANTDAVPIDKIISRAKSGKGAWSAVDILHPEDQSVICPAGFWIDEKEIEVLRSIGIDYVIMED